MRSGQAFLFILFLDLVLTTHIPEACAIHPCAPGTLQEQVCIWCLLPFGDSTEKSFFLEVSASLSRPNVLSKMQSDKTALPWCNFREADIVSVTIIT